MMMMACAPNSARITKKNLTRMLRKTIFLKYFKRENALGKRLTLRTFPRQCEELSTAMAPVSLKRMTPLHLSR